LILRTQCWGGIQYDVNAGRNLFRIHQSKQDLASCFYELWRNKMAQHAGSTITFLDMNQDGVKDMIYGDLSFKDLLLLINGRNQTPYVHKRDSVVAQDTLFPSNTVRANHILFPASYYVDYDHDGKGELFVTTNATTGVKSADNVWLYENSGTHASPVLSYVGNHLPFHTESIDLGTRSIPVLVDIDQDGDKDLVVATNGDIEETGGLSDRLFYYENISAQANQPVFALRDSNFLDISHDTAVINAHPTFGDLNGDGKPDLVMGDLNGFLMYYVNQGSGSSVQFALQSRKYAGINVGSFAAPQLVDLDKDGLLDLVIGCKDGDFKYYRNQGTASSPSFLSTPDNDSLGSAYVNELFENQGQMVVNPAGYSVPHVCDLDNDGNYEMLAGSYSGKVILFTGVKPGASSVFRRYDLIFTPDTSDLTNSYSRRDAHSAPVVMDRGSFDPMVLVGSVRGGLQVFAVTKSPTTGLGTGYSDARARILVFPNPATNLIRFSTEQLDEEITVQLFNSTGSISGSMVIDRYRTEGTLQTGGLANGIYFAVLKGTSGFTQTSKVLIAR
jgi:hypothetical protein